MEHLSLLLKLVFSFLFSFFSITKKYVYHLHISTNNIDNTGKFKVIILKRKINAKVTQTQFFNHYFSDKGLKIEKNNN